MPHDNVFKAGSLATAYHDIASWYGRQTEEIGAKEILVPFSGFGRMASGMCRPDTSMYVIDYQRVHTAIICGIFGEHELKTNVDKPRFHKGHAVAGRFVSNIDTRSAGFIDWVVKYGTWLDIACVGMSIPGQTMHGWLRSWTGSFDSLWSKFQRVRSEVEPYLRRPGGWHWRECDFFSLIDTELRDMHFDAIAVDPPRLCPTRDLYSTGWVNFNETLGGTVRIKPWTDQNYFKLLEGIMVVNADYLLFTWTESRDDENPSTREVKEFLLQYGKLETEDYWQVNRKRHHGWRIKRFHWLV